MARIRSLKPEFWLDRKLARKLTRDERMLYMGLWNQADEHARANGDPNAIKGAVFPYDEDLTVDVIAAMLLNLHDAGVAVQYRVDGDPFLWLPKLGSHQRLKPETPSRYPVPPLQKALQNSSRTYDKPNGSLDCTSEARAGSDEALLNPPDQGEQQLLMEFRTNPDAIRPSLCDREHGSGSMDQGAREARSGPVGRPLTPQPGDPFGFAEFWTAYPRRASRAAAIKAFEKAREKVDLVTLIDGARRYADDPNRDPEYTKHATTWLNQGCWDDDPLPARSNPRGRTSAVDQARRLQEMKKRRAENSKS